MIRARSRRRRRRRPHPRSQSRHTRPKPLHLAPHKPLLSPQRPLLTRQTPMPNLARQNLLPALPALHFRKRIRQSLQRRLELVLGSSAGGAAAAGGGGGGLCDFGGLGDAGHKGGVLHEALVALGGEEVIRDVGVWAVDFGREEGVDLAGDSLGSEGAGGFGGGEGGLLIDELFALCFMF